MSIKKQLIVDDLIDKAKIRKGFVDAAKRRVRYCDLIWLLKQTTGETVSRYHVEKWKKANGFARVKSSAPSETAYIKFTLSCFREEIYRVTGHKPNIKTVRIWRNKIRNEQKTN